MISLLISGFISAAEDGKLTEKHTEMSPLVIIPENGTTRPQKCERRHQHESVLNVND